MISRLSLVFFGVVCIFSDTGRISFSPSQDISDRVIDFAIRLMPFEIFVTVLESGDTEDGEKGQDDKTGRDGCKFGEELEDGDGY